MHALTRTWNVAVVLTVQSKTSPMIWTRDLSAARTFRPTDDHAFLAVQDKSYSGNGLTGFMRTRSFLENLPAAVRGISGTSRTASVSVASPNLGIDYFMRTSRAALKSLDPVISVSTQAFRP
jgi:hypothetical protein